MEKFWIGNKFCFPRMDVSCELRGCVCDWFDSIKILINRFRTSRSQRVFPQKEPFRKKRLLSFSMSVPIYMWRKKKGLSDIIFFLRNRATPIETASIDQLQVTETVRFANESLPSQMTSGTDRGQTKIKSLSKCSSWKTIVGSTKVEICYDGWLSMRQKLSANLTSTHVLICSSGKFLTKELTKILTKESFTTQFYLSLKDKESGKVMNYLKDLVVL